MTEPDYFDDFYADVGYGDPFVTVLKGHLWVEGELLRSLEAALPFPDRVDLDRSPFNQKVALVASLGLLQPDEQPGFRALNTLRNRLAHRLGSAISEQDQTDLYNALGKRHRDHIDALDSSAFPVGVPHLVRFAITAMCVQLQTDREAMQHANQRLRESAVRLITAAGRSRPRDQ